MNNPRTRRIKEIIIGQTLVGLFILAIAGYLIVYSLGYKIDFSSRKIVKEGIIVLSINPKPDKILLNNQDMGSKINASFTVESGNYNIIIKKDGYQDWKATSKVESEIVNYYKYVELFRTNVVLSDLTDQSKINYLNTPTSILIENAPKGLTYNDYEIWIADKIVARFSLNISSVSWYPDNKHVVFQQGSELKIVDDQGKNETVLVALLNDHPAKYAIGSNGTEIYISQDNTYYYGEIQ